MRGHGFCRDANMAKTTEQHFATTTGRQAWYGDVGLHRFVFQKLYMCRFFRRVMVSSLNGKRMISRVPIVWCGYW